MEACDGAIVVNTVLLLILIGAVAFDIIIGEPPRRVHPVVWMGKIIHLLEKHAPQNNRALYGAAMTFITITPFAVTGILLTRTNHIFAIIASIYLLKSTFSINMLFGSAKKIEDQLKHGRIETVRSELRTLVSRDTSYLDETKATSATIESVSENYVDGILTPMFYFVLFGLPGALVYKVVNTLDSMVGYKKPPYQQLGFVPARVDDFLNYIPARISALIIALVSNNPVTTLRCASREHIKTPSPNSGWPIAATACALGITLEKPGTYILNNEADTPEPERITSAITLIKKATVVSIVAVIILLYCTLRVQRLT